MFKEIEDELMSIISEDVVDRIAHMPTKDIAKTMELIFKVDFEDIKRVYRNNTLNIPRITVVYDDKDKSDKGMDMDLIPIEGKVYWIMLVPESSFSNKAETNAIAFTGNVIKYTTMVNSLIINQYKTSMECVDNNKLFLIIAQSIPVIICSVLRKIYSGPSLAKVIYEVLSELMPTYKVTHTEEGINSILNILDEGLGSKELLDSGFICSIDPSDKNYPGIWEIISKGE